MADKNYTVWLYNINTRDKCTSLSVHLSENSSLNIHAVVGSK